jgi:hypothetical protein
LQKFGWALFGAFANLCCLTQIPYSQEYVDLLQTAHLGKIIQKAPEPGLLQLPLNVVNWCPYCPFAACCTHFKPLD